MNTTRHNLEIYVMSDCLGSDTAHRLADRARSVPGLTVRVVDLSAPGAVRPPAVFATPTYLLDGEVVSLGNPDERWLLTRLTNQLPDRPDNA